MHRRVTLAAFVFLTSAAWAQTVPEPAETDFHSDHCAVCRMAVTDRDYAAQIVGTGEPLFFDDIGCLVQYERQKKILPSAVGARYVREVLGNAWIRAETAWWVYTKEVRTPMGYGFHAFRQKGSAESIASGGQSAQVVPWSEVLKLVPAAPGMGSGTMGKR